MSAMWKNLFYLTKREKSGLILLIILISSVFAGKIVFDKPENQLSGQDVAIPDTAIPVADTGRFENENYGKTLPNTDNSKAFTSKEHNRLPEKRTYFNNRSSKEGSGGDDSRSFSRTEKLEKGSKVNLNEADTALLMKIPGIGHAYATRILKYRKILGGYYSVEQLKEVYGMYQELYDEIIPFFEITTDSIVRMPVNTASLDKLKSHPYINFYQAKAILELRKKAGKINFIEELSMLEEFPPEELGKLKSYLLFE